MASEVHLAFAHPEGRAAATASRPLDRISVRDHVVEVEIGAFQAERGVTQRIRFNIAVEVAPHDAPLGDDVDRILSYDKVTEAIAAELADERLNQLETLAERGAHPTPSCSAYTTAAAVATHVRSDLLCTISH